MRGPWPAGAEFGVRVPAGRGAVSPIEGRFDAEHRRGEGQPAILRTGKQVSIEGGACGCEVRLFAGGGADGVRCEAEAVMV